MLKGDFYAQNFDAKSPGELAPWYPRFGHSLTTINKSSYALTHDLMILTGGYTPQPSNDVWITPDGVTWYYTGSTSFISHFRYHSRQHSINLTQPSTLYRSFSRFF